MEAQQKLDVQIMTVEVKAQVLKELFEYAKVVDNSYLPLKITEKEIRMAMVDPSHVMMLYTSDLNKVFTIKNFEKKYIREQTKDLVVSIRDPDWWIPFLKLYCKRIGKDSSIRMVLSTNSVWIGCDVLWRTSGCELDRSGPKLPSLDYHSKFKMNLLNLYEFVKDVKISDYAILMFDKEVLRVKFEDDYNKTQAIYIPKEIEKKGDSRSMYPTGYIKNLLKPIRKLDAWISYRSDYPVTISVEPFENMVVSYLLAPRIESQ